MEYRWSVYTKDGKLLARFYNRQIAENVAKYYKGYIKWEKGD